jgi:hypothetical protein
MVHGAAGDAALFVFGAVKAGLPRRLCLLAMTARGALRQSHVRRLLRAVGHT